MSLSLVGLATLIAGLTGPVSPSSARVPAQSDPSPITVSSVGELHPAWADPDSTGVTNDPPVKANGLVYDSTCGGMCAFDAVTGAVKWSNGDFGWPWVVDRTKGFGQYQPNQFTSPGFGAFDALTGATLWTDPSVEPVDASVVAGNGVVYVLGDGLTALNEKTGAVIWRTGPYSGEAGIAIGHGSVFMTGAAFLAAVNPRTGAIRWEGSTAGMTPTGYPVVNGNSVYVTGWAAAPDGSDSDFPDLYVFPAAGCGQATCVATDIERIGGTEMRPYVQVRFAGPDEILTGSDGLEVRDRATGTSWHSALANVGVPGGPAVYSLPAVTHDVVFIAQFGQLLAYDLNGCGSALCQPIWRTTYTEGGPNRPDPPAVAGDTLYLAGANGTDAWRVTPPG